MDSDHLILAGGGHSHITLLFKWNMNPRIRPKGLITLISEDSTTLYSAMLPGIISKHYQRNEALIDLRKLANAAKVAFIKSKIVGLEPHSNLLLLDQRPSIYYDRISLNIGSETNLDFHDKKLVDLELAVPIKPFKDAISWVNSQEEKILNRTELPFNVIGDGLSGIEIALALRKRWPNRIIRLYSNKNEPEPLLKKAISFAGIELFKNDSNLEGPSLICTGSRMPEWIKISALTKHSSGRILTSDTLQSVDYLNIFAVGDCGVIQKNFRPPSGVWAVRSADILAKNLFLADRNLPLLSWFPQRKALQLVGSEINNKLSGWAIWGGFIIGPYSWIWWLKEKIDRNFMGKFNSLLGKKMLIEKGTEVNACRGCGAKISSSILKDSLKQARYSFIADHPEDAAVITALGGKEFLQSLDGFPALVSDPWLNGRLTALHASSDLWACGASVFSAQALITLPAVSGKIQQELLAQTLEGIRSALSPQGAELLGGHTLEARSKPNSPYSYDLQVSLSINGGLEKGQRRFTKSGLQRGDSLFLSRAIGSGVLFSAEMAGKCLPKYLDEAIEILSTSQHNYVEFLRSLEANSSEESCIHTCTDITGFGLLGHLSEMLDATNFNLIRDKLSPLRIKLDAFSIPSLKGSLTLLEKGYFSTLAPANRKFWNLLYPKDGKPPLVELEFKNNMFTAEFRSSIMELLVDPQTCGPLIVSCDKNKSGLLEKSSLWNKIGEVV